jgi:hypothetical protein
MIYSQNSPPAPHVGFPKYGENLSSKSHSVAIRPSSAVEPHGSRSRLHMVELSGEGMTDSPARTVIDSVWEPPSAVDDGELPGIYVLVGDVKDVNIDEVKWHRITHIREKGK